MGRTTALVASALVLAATAAGLSGSAAGAAPPGSPPAADPAVPGPYAVEVHEYDGGPTVLTDPEGLTYPGEIHGVAHYPATGAGPFPLVVYLHGNHGTCAFLGAEAVAYPCPETPATAPVANHRGYDHLGRNLASHGYVTVSIDANAVNTYNVAGDRGANERAQLIARTLDHVAGLAEGTAVDLEGAIGDDLAGRVDMERIGMMGHSRGGEGVSMFITYNETRTDGPRYGIDAVMSLAGTDYNLPRASGTHFATLLPLCDGDVYDLQAAFPYDRHRFDPQGAPFARHQFTVAGTNHNFYNTTWVRDDFSTSPTAGRCSTGAAENDRLSPEDTRRMGITFVNGFMRRYVGGEVEFSSLLDGTSPLPDSACPGGVGPCDELVGRSYLAPAADRRMVVGPAAAGEPTTITSEGAPITNDGFALSFCDPRPDGGTDGKNRDPGTSSGCPSNPYRSRARALTLAWSGPSTLRIDLGADGDVSRHDVLSFRAATNFGTPTNADAGPTDLVVALTDVAGNEATFAVSDLSDALVPMRPDPARKLTMNGVSVPLAAAAARGVDLTAIEAVELRAGDTAAGLPGSGSIQLAELAFQRTGAAPPPPVVPEAPLPVLLPVAGAGVLLLAAAASGRWRRVAAGRSAA